MVSQITAPTHPDALSLDEHADTNVQRLSGKSNRPCPWCQSSLMIVMNINPRGRFPFAGVCSSCLCQGPKRGDKKQAAIAWNNPALPEPSYSDVPAILTRILDRTAAPSETFMSRKQLIELVGQYD